MSDRLIHTDVRRTFIAHETDASFNHGDPPAPAYARPTRMAQTALAAERRRIVERLHAEEICGEDQPLRDGERVTILRLNGKTCRWPIGDVGAPDFHYCGAKPEPGRSYCAYHCGIAGDRRAR